MEPLDLILKEKVTKLTTIFISIKKFTGNFKRQIIFVAQIFEYSLILIESFSLM